jgi:hypothetical protein
MTYQVVTDLEHQERLGGAAFRVKGEAPPFGGALNKNDHRFK